MTTRKIAILDKAFRFLGPRHPGVPGLGIALGRHALWAVYAKEADGKPLIEWGEKVPLESGLFSSEPPPETDPGLASAVRSLAQKIPGAFLNLQVALPDPAVRLEVFELDKIPPRGAPLGEFLSWRFNQEKDSSAPPLAFSGQILGEEDGKALFLAVAVERRWLEAVEKAVQSSGLKASVTDMALGFRFNYFHDSFQGQGGGALVTFDPEYWSLALWDKETRPRFARSKWWPKEVSRLRDIPLEPTALEIERTIRSYVYSGKGRNVEKLFVLAPEEWLGPVLKALNLRTDGKCVGLPMAGPAGKKPGLLLEGISPSAVAAAAARR